MTTQTPRKPKRVVSVDEAVLQDRTISNLIQTSGVECAPVASEVRERQIQEATRRSRENNLTSETNGQNGTWAFVKNHNTKETIKFKDGTTFIFPSNIYIVTNKEEADKILEVADNYGIVLK